ncbi:DUF6527 family protein [Mumia sp. DW29H23]|uniref:DUF6527 family protein n=1 Tax=Mumia sp. DW29H23 TaxID=3421241 RepID=UPI003D68BDA6
MRVTRLQRAVVNWSRRARHRPRARIVKVVFVTGRGDLPAAMNPRRIYRLGNPGKWAVLECPCGRGHVIELNLAHAGRDRWTLTTDPEGRPSTRPSIDSRGASRCHFWLRGGRIDWA